MEYGEYNRGTVENQHSQPPPSPNIRLCADGKMRWAYELNLFKAPFILLLLFKIFFFSFLGIFIFVVLLELPDIENVMNAVTSFGPAIAIILMVILLICTLSYLIWALILGGKYCVLFEMDHNGVNHIQIKKQFKKAQVMGYISALVGAAANNLTLAGAGLAAGNKQSLYSKFTNVRKIIVIRRHNLIKLNGTLIHNQVYTLAEDFDFILTYIHSHCPNAATKEIKH